ncbi:putative ATP-dependent RNA helicase BoYb [Drosophila albomicans]|uniref:RNA helicase n=1 Tax=Drosophila albomicans TaxID=7291 RepID=A0A6P8WEX7_DROAB|nr:putative ATP-dependent RNA helicase BoYb [Drosophila albomicans]
MTTIKKLTDGNNNNSKPENFHYAVQEDTFSFAQHERPLLAANCSEYAVAHSNKRLQPARRMDEVSFLPHIVHSMRRLRLTALLRLQSYAWPHLSQGAGHGAIIVGAPRSGRTLSYVPPLCQQVCMMLSQLRGGQRWELLGPIAVVLAADLSRVQQIGAVCNTMLRKAKNEEWLSLVLTVPSSQTPEFFQRLLNGVGCLVATPAQFQWLCNVGLIQMPYLSFVVYDDVDLMLPDQLHKAHQHVLSLTKQKRPQLVITTQSYNHKLLGMVNQINAHPMVLFGDILEAALYGGTRMRLTLLESKSKQQELLQLLQQRPPHLIRTVINCHNDADILDLVDFLGKRGYACLPYYQMADMEVRDHVYRWMVNTRGELLLCTDNCPELDIRHAQTLVHYSLSDSWSKFKLRHLALTENLRNQFEQPLKLNEKHQFQGEDSKELRNRKSLNHNDLLSIVFLDETNNKELPRLVEFLQMRQQVDERIVCLARHIRNESERSKCNEPALCDLLLSLGHCANSQCEERHQLLPYDRQLQSMLPTSGDVKLQLVRVYSPSHYCVRLLEHLPAGGKWQSLRRRASLDLQLQLLQSQECLRHWPPKAKQICVYRNDYGYERVRILHVAPIELINLSRNDVAVVVQAMDVDTRQIKTTSGKLYVCPDELLNKPQLALDLRILGMVPYTGEWSWHEEDAQQCSNWINAVPKPNFLQASIAVTLSHTIFVHDLAVINYASSLQLHVRRLNMCQQLALHKLATKSGQAVTKLMQFLTEVKDEPEIKEKLSMHQEVLDEQLQSQQPLQEIKLITAKGLSGRSKFFAKMAIQLGKENRERSEYQQHVQQQQQQKQVNLEHSLIKHAEKTSEPESGIEALHDCLMRCTLLELSQESDEKKFSIGNCRMPEELLKQLVVQQEHTPNSKPESCCKQNKIKIETTAVNTTTMNNRIHSRIPKNAVRPEVKYYQTLCTLELQVVLPEDKMPYDALLFNGSCIVFFTIGTSGSTRYQFTLNTHCPYQSFSHHQQGRTVYISILKTLAITYPLEFNFYKFMKPQHEKLIRIEEQRRERVFMFESYLLHKGLIQGRSVSYDKRDSDVSSDEHAEDPFHTEGAEYVERALNAYEYTCE